MSWLRATNPQILILPLYYSLSYHAGANIRACDAIRHTVLDGFFDVICSVVALNFVRAHPFSRTLFNIVAIYLISEAHSGYDFPWSSHNVLTFIAGPVIHSKHHSQGSCNFAKFFVWCDVLFSTLSTWRHSWAEFDRHEAQKIATATASWVHATVKTNFRWLDPENDAMTGQPHPPSLSLSSGRISDLLAGTSTEKWKRLDD